MNRDIYFDLDIPLPPVNEVDINEIVRLRISEYIQSQGLIKSNNFLGSMEENLGYFSPLRNMFSVVGEKDANFGVFSNDVSTLFLGTTTEFLSLEQLKKLTQRSDWYKFNITEWVSISNRPRKQSTLYLNAFDEYGLKPYGDMMWKSFNGQIAFCEVRNADGSRFINAKEQE